MQFDILGTTLIDLPTIRLGCSQHIGSQAHAYTFCLPTHGIIDWVCEQTKTRQRQRQAVNPFFTNNSIFRGSLKIQTYNDLKSWSLPTCNADKDIVLPCNWQPLACWLGSLWLIGRHQSLDRLWGVQSQTGLHRRYHSCQHHHWEKSRSNSDDRCILFGY